MSELTCSACGGQQFLRPYSPWHSTPICDPCFMLWYETGITNPSQLGARSLELKTKGEFPWDGQYQHVGDRDPGDENPEVRP